MNYHYTSSDLRSPIQERKAPKVAKPLHSARWVHDVSRHVSRRVQVLLQKGIDSRVAELIAEDECTRTSVRLPGNYQREWNGRNAPDWMDDRTVQAAIAKRARVAAKRASMIRGAQS